MIREIVHDPVFLARPSKPATEEDLPVAEDLIDTLKANRDRCVGLAANMIGKSGEFEAEEGCLSLEGTRKTTRYRSIRLSWQDVEMKEHVGTLDGFQAQIVQHEIDHCDGKLI